MERVERDSVRYIAGTLNLLAGVPGARGFRG